MTGDRAKKWIAHGVPNSVLITKPFVLTQVIVALSNLINRVSSEN